MASHYCSNNQSNTFCCLMPLWKVTGMASKVRIVCFSIYRTAKIRFFWNRIQKTQIFHSFLGMLSDSCICLLRRCVLALWVILLSRNAVFHWFVLWRGGDSVWPANVRRFRHSWIGWDGNGNEQHHQACRKHATQSPCSSVSPAWVRNRHCHPIVFYW